MRSTAGEPSTYVFSRSSMPRAATKAASLLKTAGRAKLKPGEEDDTPEIDYRAHPEEYRVLTGERNVYNTQPYSNELKGSWKFKDKKAAEESCEALFRAFEEFRDSGDFVGMDVSRKFVQMGYTRSIRYALRPGGRKYDKETGEEIPRTGEIADDEKYEGSMVFKECWERIEEDEVYSEAKIRWKEKYEKRVKKERKSRPE